MCKVERIIDQLLAILADDHEITGVAHLQKLLRGMAVNRCDKLCHLLRVVDAGPGVDRIPVLKTVDDIEVEPVKPGCNDLVEIVEYDFLPGRVPVFDLEVVGPFRIGPRHPAGRVGVPTGLPVRAVIFGLADAQIADHQLVVATAHDVQFGGGVLPGRAAGRSCIINDHEASVRSCDLLRFSSADISEMIKPRLDAREWVCHCSQFRYDCCSSGVLSPHKG